MPVSSAATKEIYLLVGTQGVDKAKAELKSFNDVVKATNEHVLSYGKSAYGAGFSVEKFGKQNKELEATLKRSAYAAKESAAAIKTQTAATDEALSRSSMFTDTLKMMGDAAGKTVSVLMRMAYLLPGLGFAGIVGGIVSAFSGVINAGKQTEEQQKELAAQIKRTNEALAAQKKHLEDIAALQFGAFSAARGQIANAAGVDADSLSVGALGKAAELAKRAEQNSVTRNSLEREYLEILRQQADLRDRGKNAANPMQEAAVLNLATLSGKRRQIVEANLRRTREEAIDIRKAYRDAVGGELPDGKKEKAEKPDWRKDVFLRGLVAQLEAEQEIREQQRKGDAAALAASDKAVAALRKTQDAEFDVLKTSFTRKNALLEKQQKEEEAAKKQRFTEGVDAGATGGMFAFLAEDLAARGVADRIRGIETAIHDGITRPAQIANEATQALGMGLADAAAGAILEGKSFKTAANEVLKAVAKKALAMAIFEGAAALASLAILDFRGATLHGQAAATYGAVAAVTGIGAAATGGFGSGKGSSGGSASGTNVGAERANTNTGGANGGGAAVYYFTVNYNGLRTSARDHEDLIRILNSQAGRNGAARIDRRMVG